MSLHEAGLKVSSAEANTASSHGPKSELSSREKGAIVVKASPPEAGARSSHGTSKDLSSRETTALAVRDTVLTTSFGPGPVTYVSRAHAVEFELQDGSLDEELSLEITIAKRLAFVDCRTEEAGRWDTRLCNDGLIYPPGVFSLHPTPNESRSFGQCDIEGVAVFACSQYWLLPHLLLYG